MQNVKIILKNLIRIGFGTLMLYLLQNAIGYMKLPATTNMVILIGIMVTVNNEISALKDTMKLVQSCWQMCSM